jgi:flagellar basal body rod protein FlgG
MESVDLLANNLANSSTPGFKSDLEHYSLYDALDVREAGESLSQMPLVEGRWTDWRPGTLVNTGRELDLALEGPGFFVAESPQGVLHTRNGSLRLSPAGLLLTRDGFELVTVEPQRIRADPNLPLEIATDGAVSQQGRLLGHLRLEAAAGSGAAALEKRSGAYFAWNPAAGQAVTPRETVVRQGHLETSNSDAAASSARLIHLLRQFESLQKATQLGAEMNRRASEDLARVSS